MEASIVVSMTTAAAAPGLPFGRALYEAAGCPPFWIVDPDEPNVTVWELRDGSYELAGEASGQEVLMVERPFPVRIVPELLLD